MILPQALLLDLDDTILDITGSADVCWRALSAEHAPSLGLAADQLCAAIVKARTAFWADQERLDRFLDRLFESPPASWQELLDTP